MQTDFITYFVSCNLTKDKSAIQDLIRKEKRSIILSNRSHQIHFLGILPLHHCFENLKKEFSDSVKMTIIDVDSSMAALWSAIKLGYTKSTDKKIKHSFESSAVKSILNNSLPKNSW